MAPGEFKCIGFLPTRQNITPGASRNQVIAVATGNRVVAGPALEAVMSIHTIQDVITRQANAALAAKEESIQGLLKATRDAREQEMKDILTSETKKIEAELTLGYETKLQNELAHLRGNIFVKLKMAISRSTST